MSQVQPSQPAAREALPVKLYRSHDRLTVAAPMPGLEPDDIQVEVCGDGRLILRCDRRAGFKGGHQVLLDEWPVGGYARELRLPDPVDGSSANVTYGNGVLVVALPLAAQTRAAVLTLDVIGEARGEHAGNQGHPVRAISHAEHQAVAHARARAARTGRGAPHTAAEPAGGPAGGWSTNVVEEASEESFPASDAPSWVGGPPD